MQVLVCIHVLVYNMVHNSASRIEKNDFILCILTQINVQT